MHTHTHTHIYTHTHIHTPEYLFSKNLVGALPHGQCMPLSLNYVDLNFVIFFSIKQSNIQQNPIKLYLIFFLKFLTKLGMLFSKKKNL